MDFFGHRCNSFDYYCSVYIRQAKSTKSNSNDTSYSKRRYNAHKLESNTYTLVKVNRVKGDSVFLFLNKFQTNKLSGIDDLKSKGYETFEEGFTISDLKAMDKKEEIIDIERYK